jgi:hypothetical protein
MKRLAAFLKNPAVGMALVAGCIVTLGVGVVRAECAIAIVEKYPDGENRCTLVRVTDEGQCAYSCKYYRWYSSTYEESTSGDGDQEQ